MLVSAALISSLAVSSAYIETPIKKRVLDETVSCKLKFPSLS